MVTGKAEMNKLLPQEIVTLLDGTGVEVSPVPFGRMNIFSNAVANLLQKLKEKGIGIKSIKDYQMLFDVAFEEVIVIMGLVLQKDRDWFDTMGIPDGLGLLDKIVEQNFSEDSKKKLQSLVERVGSLFQTSSSSLSVKDTDGKT